MIGSAEERFWAKVDKVDEPDGCWLWRPAKAGRYGYFWWNGRHRTVPAHRFAYMLLVGDPGPELDHRATCPKNCVNPTHLRPSTRKQNAENLLGARSDSASGVRGVQWHEPLKKWRAYVRHNGHKSHIGYFVKLEDAAEAARIRRNELFTHNDADRG